MNVDAFIVATPGVIKLCRDIAPNIPIHLSTQANVLNYMDAAAYVDMGVERIIAAREIGLKDLVSIKEKLPKLEIEIFVHGSMCFAYSGRCLISSLQMGRVANKGSCANDCRFQYEVYAKAEESDAEIKLVEGDEGTYIFNAKDLNLIEYVKQIMDLGVVDSLKIEGRTKAHYYLGVATRTYRDAIDEVLAGEFNPQRLKNELATIKNRGYTDGYLVKRPFERKDTQNHKEEIGAGTMQVVAIVTESGKYFMAKHKFVKNHPYEVVVPHGGKIDFVDNEIGKVYEDNGTVFVVFKKIITEKGKELEEIHSGNVNPVELPTEFLPYTLIRGEV